MAHRLYEEYMQRRNKQEQKDQRGSMSAAPHPDDMPPPYLMPRDGGEGTSSGRHRRHTYDATATVVTAGAAAASAAAAAGGIQVTVVPPADCPPRSLRSQPRPWDTSCNFTQTSASESGTSSGLGQEMHRLMQRPASLRKSKSVVSTTSSLDDSSCSSSVDSVRTYPERKQNHSEIEKRRRDKMNVSILELSTLVPQCRASSRKLDKLTILRLAVQHVKAVHERRTSGPLMSMPEPSVLPRTDLNKLVTRAVSEARCMMVVVSCEHGRILYASGTCEDVLHYNNRELLGQSLFDIVSPKDVPSVKEQMLTYDLSAREEYTRSVDLMAGGTHIPSGARRSFYCRVKCPVSRDDPRVKDDPEGRINLPKKYIVIHCTGHLRWLSISGLHCAAASPTLAECDEPPTRSVLCLVAMVKPVPDLPAAQIDFVSRHGVNGNFLWADQQVTRALGYLQQDLIGTSLYDYVAPDKAAFLAQSMHAALSTSTSVEGPAYLFRRRDGLYSSVVTRFKRFVNPWTQKLDFLYGKHTVIPPAPSSGPASGQTHTQRAALHNNQQEVALGRDAGADATQEVRAITAASGEQASTSAQWFSSGAGECDASTEVSADADNTSALSHLSEAVGEAVQRMIGSHGDGARAAHARNNEQQVELLHHMLFPPEPSQIEGNNEATGSDNPSPSTSTCPHPAPVEDADSDANIIKIMRLLEDDGPTSLNALSRLFP